LYFSPYIGPSDQGGWDEMDVWHVWHVWSTREIYTRFRWGNLKDRIRRPMLRRKCNIKMDLK
jgi:hypothetical protein